MDILCIPCCEFLCETSGKKHLPIFFMTFRDQKHSMITILALPFVFCSGFYYGMWFASHDMKKSFTRSAAVKTRPLCEPVSTPLNASSNMARKHADTLFNQDEPVFCAKNPKCTSPCHHSHDVKDFLAARSKYSAHSRMAPRITIFADEGLRSFHHDQPWYKQFALDRCPTETCSVVSDRESANVILANINAPEDRQPNITYAVVNLEAHSYKNLPAASDNVMLVSYHAESDLIINYAYTITHRMAVCIGHRIDGRTCENVEDPTTSFYKWCTRSFHGDLLTCLFNVMPHMTRMNGVNKSSQNALAPTWISNHCERHNGYLVKLMKLLPIDSMAGCYNNRDEGQHPGLALKDHDSLWWGAGNTVTNSTSGNGPRKIVLASHYWFFVSIENTIMDDYVTEKFYEGFLADTLMVYFGAPNARDYAPANHSYIHALDFESPEALAEFLLLLRGDRERYESYFWWKREVPAAISPRFREQMRLGLEHTNEDSMLCRLCSKLSALTGSG